MADRRPLVSAALIVRDEAHHLRGCLDSLGGLADEVVVVDTGSLDGSPDVARGAGAVVHHRRWTGDFAAARNVALDHCRGQWILYIDADERVASGGAVEETRSALAGTDALGVLVRFTPATGFTWYRECRLFRNDPGIRFERRIHERIVPSIERLAQDRGQAPWATVPLHLLHLGYDAERPARHRRDLPLLEAEHRRLPDDVATCYRLGVARAGLGDRAGAQQAWVSGAAASAACGDTHPLGGMCLVELVRMAGEDGMETGPLLEEALRRFPANRLLVWLDGRRHLRPGGYERAAELFGELAGADAEVLAADGLAYDSRLFASWALDGLGSACFALGRYAEAEAAFTAASEAEPHVLGYRAKQVAAARRAARLAASERVAG